MKHTRILAMAIFATAAVAAADDVVVVPPPPPPPPAPVAVDPAPPAPVVVVPVPAAPAPAPADDFVDVDGDGRDDRFAPVRREPSRWEPPSKLGMGVVVGGGVTDFITDRASRNVETGPEWAARLNVGTRSIIGAEAAYVGSTNQVAGFGTNRAQFMSHGVQGLARVNFTPFAVQPYLAAGVGYRHYSLVNVSEGQTSDLRDSADVAEIPAATGIAVRARGLIFDGRFNVGIPISTPAMRNMPSSAAASTWGVNANVGFEF